MVFDRVRFSFNENHSNRVITSNRFWRKTDRVSSGHFDNDRQAPKDGPQPMCNPRGKRVYRPSPRVHTTCRPDMATWTVLLRRRHKRRYPVSLDARGFPSLSFSGLKRHSISISVVNVFWRGNGRFIERVVCCSSRCLPTVTLGVRSSSQQRSNTTRCFSQTHAHTHAQMTTNR